MHENHFEDTSICEFADLQIKDSINLEKAVQTSSFHVGLKSFVAHKCDMQQKTPRSVLHSL